MTESEACAVERVGYELYRRSKQMQLYRGIDRRGAGEHGADQPWLEFLELVHQIECQQTQPPQALAVCGGLEQPLPLSQTQLDLGVARQGTEIADGESLCRLPLGEPEIDNSVLDHQPRGFLRELLAKILQLRP